ncbi:MAG: hypothetical protein NZM07_06575 [Elioraea sp.]|nr:hypothetical protein [Elioraea sp.]
MSLHALALVGSTASSHKIIQDRLENSSSQDCKFSLGRNSWLKLVHRCWQHVILVIEFRIAPNAVASSRVQSEQFASWIRQQLAALKEALDVHAGITRCSSNCEKRCTDSSPDCRDVLYRRISFTEKAADPRALTNLFEGEPGHDGFVSEDLEKLRKIYEAFQTDQRFRHV